MGFAVPALPRSSHLASFGKWLEVGKKPCHMARALVFQCPPCRSLTRVLVESYRKIKEAGQKFEIIFVSADRYGSSFKCRRHITFPVMAYKCVFHPVCLPQCRPWRRITDNRSRILALAANTEALPSALQAHWKSNFGSAF